MPSMTNPMNALDSMQRLLSAKRNIPKIIPCELNNFFMVVDNQNGYQRFCYFKIDGSLVKSMSIFAPADPIDGALCFGVGYAVAPRHRRVGLGREIVSIGIAELKNGLNRNGILRFYIEAVVALANIASQKVAESTISLERNRCIDSHSGTNAYVYRKLIA